MELNIKINKDGLDNEDIKHLLEHMSDFNMRSIKKLCKGDIIPVRKGVGIECTFTIS